MKMILSILLSMAIFSTCEKQNESPESVNKFLPAETHLNVSYGKDTLQRMDIYLPEGRSIDETKTLILIHGGGWNGGNKSDFAGYIDSFKKRLPDYAIFNINYRLVNGGNYFPAQENDVKAAMNYINDKAGKYNINKNKLVLLGASAGAHLALLQAYKYTNPQVSAVINFFGPTDLMVMYEKPWHPLVPYALQMITGTTPVHNAKIFRESSPVNYISSQSAPTLIFHGAKDNIVDVSQSMLLRDKLKSSDVAHELVVYKSHRHGWHGPTLSHSFNKIENFLKEHVK